MSAEPRDVARRALGLTGADDVQVTVTRMSSRQRRFTAGEAPPPAATEQLDVHVLAVHDGHAGGAVAAGTSDAELRAALDEAMHRAASEAVAHPGLPEPHPVRAHGGHDPATARHEPGPAETAIATVRAGAGGAEVDGVWTTSATEIAIASRAGLDLHDSTTRALLDVTLRDRATGRTGAACAVAVRASAVDAAGVAARARAVLALGGPAATAPGPLPVVLGPEAVAAVLTLLGATAFDGRAHAEGRGALTGRLGTRVAASAVNLSDSPRFTGTLPAAFDLEGVPKGPVPLIQDGVAHRVVHDLGSAARAGTTSTGHAASPGGDGAGPHPQHLVLIGGGAADVEELCAPISDGLFVTRLHYDAATGDAVTHDGTLQIAGGRLAGPAADVRLHADPLAVLAGVEALTMGQWLIPAADRAAVVAPALRTSGMTVIGPF